jgi:hypothetical protein
LVIKTLVPDWYSAENPGSVRNKSGCEALLVKPLFSFLGSCSDASRMEDYSDSELEADCGPPPSSPSLFLLELVLGCADQAVDTAAAHQPTQSFRIKIPKQSQLTEVTLLTRTFFLYFFSQVPYPT